MNFSVLFVPLGGPPDLQWLLPGQGADPGVREVYDHGEDAQEIAGTRPQSPHLLAGQSSAVLLRELFLSTIL